MALQDIAMAVVAAIVSAVFILWYGSGVKDPTPKLDKLEKEGKDSDAKVEEAVKAQDAMDVDIKVKLAVAKEKNDRIISDLGEISKDLKAVAEKRDRTPDEIKKGLEDNGYKVEDF